MQKQENKKYREKIGTSKEKNEKYVCINQIILLIISSAS